MSELTPEGKPKGRKWGSMLIGCAMLLVGVILFHFLGIDFEHFWKYVTGVVSITEGYQVLNVLNKKFTNGG